jgi:hypothetical protein
MQIFTGRTQVEVVTALIWKQKDSLPAASMTEKKRFNFSSSFGFNPLINRNVQIYNECENKLTEKNFAVFT